MSQSQGVEAGLSINDKKFCFVSIEDQSTYTRVDASADSLCGMLEHLAEEVTQGIVTPRLKITMMPSPAEFDELLPLIGFSQGEDDSWYPITSITTNPALTVKVNRVASIDIYESGVVDSWTIRAQKGTKPWLLELEILFAAKPKIDAGGSWEPTPIMGDTAPYAFSQSIYSINSKTHKTQSIVLRGEHKCFVQHNNSVFPTSVKPTDQLYYFGADFPYSTADEVALVTAFTGKNTDQPSQAGYGGLVTFTSGSVSTVFEMCNLKGDINPPTIGGREEIRNRSWYQIYGTQVGEDPVAALVITNTIPSSGD